MFGKKHSLGKMWIEDYRVFTLYLFSNKTVPWHTNEDLIMVPLIQQTIDIKLLRRMLPPNLFAGDYFIHMKKFVCLSYWLLRWVELIKCQFCCVGVYISTLENSRYVHYSLQLNGVENIFLLRPILAHASVESCLHLDVGIPLEVLYEQVVGGEHTLQPVLGDHRGGGPSTG